MEKQNITVKGKDYLVSFPNVGQLMDIESFKIAYTNGKYIDMAMSNLQIHRFALDTTDAVAYLSILIPDLITDLGVKNWRQISPLLAKELIRVFKKQFIPWFKPLIEDLYKYDSDEEEQTEGEGTE